MPEKEKLSFEQCLERLEEVVRHLEGGQTSLEESLKLFAEGVELLSSCQEELLAAEKTVQMLIAKAEGEIVRRPFRVGEEDLGGL
ncbi:MAG: exodeoxyribonuclease VII small subunit [Bacillota bacterium]|jgi:exodeoxyribonuclease VII small subunit